MIELAQKGDSNAVESIFLQYRPFVKFITHKYFVTTNSMGNDDIELEGMIGLWEAILCYKKERGSSFDTFARICVKRKVLALLKKIKKEQNIQFSVIDDHYSSNASNPEDTLIAKETLNHILSILSKLERKILLLHLRGFSYTEIATKLGRTNKSVDNGLNRIRAKAKLVVFNYSLK